MLLPRLPTFPTRRSSDLVVCGTERQADILQAVLQLEPGRLVALFGDQLAVVLVDRRAEQPADLRELRQADRDRKSTRLNSSHSSISYAVFCLKKKKTKLS